MSTNIIPHGAVERTSAMFRCDAARASMNAASIEEVRERVLTGGIRVLTASEASLVMEALRCLAVAEHGRAERLEALADMCDRGPSW